MDIRKKNKILNNKTFRFFKLILFVLLIISSVFFVVIPISYAYSESFPPRTIWGYVSYYDGSPAVGASVVVSTDGFPDETGTTDSIGAYQVDVGPDSGTEWPIGTFFTVTATKNGLSGTNVSKVLGINTRCDIVIRTSEPESDLNCRGEITQLRLKPGTHMLTGEFYVENIGASGSSLDWNIAYFPDFGTTWICSPSDGYNLKPEDGGVKVDVSFDVTGGKNEDFSDSIMVVNMNNPVDYDTVSVVVSYQINKVFSKGFIDFQQYPLLFKILKLFF